VTSDPIRTVPKAHGQGSARGFVLAMILGTLGGWLFFRLHVPLAFMIGALVFTTAAAMAGMPVSVPKPLRGIMIIVLGIMLGSTFTPSLLARLNEWSISLAGLMLYIVAASWLGIVYLRRVARYDGVTAYFTAMPGGFNEMVLMGGALGGDDRTIALGHSLRIMMVVMSVPFAFQALPGYEAGARDWSLRGLGPDFLDIGLADAALLLACLLGAPAAERLRIPAGTLVGPMLLSAAIHLSGVTEARPPGLLVAMAQIVVGAAIGGRFVGVALSRLLHMTAVAAGLTAILLVATLMVAALIHAATDLDLAALILAYAPGGLAEMSLVALALDVDPAFVASHHIIRIMIIILFAPAAYRVWYARRTLPLPDRNGAHADGSRDPPGMRKKPPGIT